MTKVKTRPAARIPIWTECDNLTNALLNNRELSEAEESTLNRINEVWAILCQNPTPVAVVKIMKKFDIKRPPAHRWIAKAEDFYGEISNVKVDAERIKQKMRLEAVIFDENTPVGDKIRAEKLLSEILGTKQGEVNRKPKTRRIVRRTTNPRALREEVIEEKYE